MIADPRSGLAVRHDVGWSVRVAHRHQPLLTYVTPRTTSSRSPRGRTSTRSGRSAGIWSACSAPNVGPHNLWGGPTYVRGEGDVRLEDDGSMDHERFTHPDVVRGDGDREGA